MSENEINKIVSDNLNRLLEIKGTTQQELAEYVGVSQATISNWCKGVKMPRMDKIDKICEFFCINRSDLMSGDIEGDINRYYLNDSAAEAAKELYERDELRVLFDAARDVSEEDIRYVAALLEKLKKKEGK